MDLIALARSNAAKLRARFDDPQDDPVAFAVVQDVHDLANELEKTRGQARTMAGAAERFQQALRANEDSEDARLAIAEEKLAALTGPDARERLARHLYIKAAPDDWRPTAELGWDRHDERIDRDCWLTRAAELLTVITGQGAPS